EPETETDPEPETGDTAATEEAVPVIGAPAAVVADAEPEPEDFSTYVRKIEEAAARSRAERRGAAMAGHRPVVINAHPAATTATPRRAAAVRQVRPHTARTAHRGRGRRRTPPPVQKPFFRRRRTWLFILGFLLLIPVVVVALYAGNVIRLGLNAYQ